jgi:hypothetical protein
MKSEFEFNAWAQPHARPRHETAQGECKATKKQETRCWERTVCVPEGMQPIDLIREYSHGLPLPPFHALQLTVNKRDVECIASAMANPDLRWHNMYYFTIARYDAPHEKLNGAWVLISGHHRFLAYLLSGAPPSEACPLRVIIAPFATSLFPWSNVIWGK